MYAQVRGTRLFYDVEGMALVPTPAGMRERPTAILVHGGPGADHTNMKVTHQPLSATMQLVFFDQRGHGRSDRDEFDRCTLDEAAQDLEAFRKHLGLGPIVTIGGSYGGMVAMAHAARYPNAVSRLVLSATAAHHGLLARAREIVAERGTPQQLAAFLAMIEGKLDTAERVAGYFHTMAPLYSRTFDGSAGESAAGGAILNDELARRAFGPGGFMQQFDLRSELHRITAPTLILAGRHDFVCAPEFSEEIASLIPNSRLEVLENSAHLLALDEPEAFIEAVSAFVRERQN